MKTRTLFGALVSVFVGVASVGCAPPPAEAPAPAPAVKAPDIKMDVAAGIEVTQSADVNRLPKLYASASGKYGPARRDPFALTGEEKNFDQAQTAERILAGGGFDQMHYEEPEDKEATLEIEPQPPRRLLGVIVGDAVLALIDMGDGRPSPELIRPGTKIPNSEWTVVSIDGDKAVLRRPGNKLPREITVKLEPPSALGGGGGVQGGPQGNPDGGPIGGAPGGGAAGGGGKPRFGK